MKISKIALALFIANFFLFVPLSSFGQTETLDIVQYTPPKGWAKTPKDGAVVYSDVNQTANTFCVLTIYSSTTSAGTPQKDFANQWNALVVKPLMAEANPKTESKTRPDGWQTTTAASAIESGGVKSIAILAVFSGFGKTTSVLAVLNDQSYVPQLEGFVDGLQLNKKKASANANPVIDQSNQPGKFGSMIYASPAGWTEQQFSDGVVFKPSDLPADENLAIQIMPALNFSGTLEQALSQSYDEAAAMYKSTKMHSAGGGNYSKQEAQKSFNGWEYIRGKGGVQVENGTPYKAERGLELFVIKVNDRFERVAILESRKNCNLGRFYASDRRIYRNAIENFLFSLRFADWNEAPLKSGSAVGAGIGGEWGGISLTVGLPTIGANLGVGLEALSPIFLSNGQAFFGSVFPIDGLAGVNTRILPA